MYTTDIDENREPRKTYKNMPSFSSSLLDEIDNSIDRNDALKKFDEMLLRKQSHRSRAKSRSMAEEDIASFPSTAKDRAVASRRRLSLMSELEKSAFQERDFLFFSSTNSTSSDSTLSSLDEHRKNKTDHQIKVPIIKSKSTAHKIYAGLKKVKRPISPAGRLRSFIISIFKSSKSKKTEGSKGLQVRDPSGPSASSTIDREEHGKRPKSPLAPDNNGLEEMKMRASWEENRRSAAKCIFKSKSDLSVFRDEDGNFSDSSSDLFELDHNTLFGNKRFCDEVPMYQTTVF